MRRLEKDAKKGRAAYNIVGLMVLIILFFVLAAFARNVNNERRLAEKYAERGK